MKKNVSVLLTVHNKEFLIERVCDGIINNISKNVNQIIVVFDGCTDKSEELTKPIINTFKGKIDYVFTEDVYETKANNAGMKMVDNDYVISIQDDMVVTESNFDLRMIEPFHKFNDVFAVTSFVAHNNIYNKNSKSINYIDVADKKNSDRDVFYAREYANRGPIMYDFRDFEKLNYYDEWFAPCSYDDLDICLRAVRQLNKVSGLYWIDYLSDLSWGSRNLKQEFFRNQYHINAQKIYERYGDMANDFKINENRKMT